MKDNKAGKADFLNKLIRGKASISELTPCSFKFIELSTYKNSGITIDAITGEQFPAGQTDAYILRQKAKYPNTFFIVQKNYE